MVIDIDGDGSLNMTIQEMAVCHRYQLGVKIMVINNQWLGMVRQWQDMIYKGHRAASNLTDKLVVGKSVGEQIEESVDVYPDFVKIADGYSVKAERVTSHDLLEDAIKRMLANPNEPYLLDVIVEAEENVFPMIPAGGTYRDIIMNLDELENRIKVMRQDQGSNI